MLAGLGGAGWPVPLLCLLPCRTRACLLVRPFWRCQAVHCVHSPIAAPGAAAVQVLEGGQSAWNKEDRDVEMEK